MSIVDILVGSTLFQGRGFLHLKKGSIYAYPLKATVIQWLVRLAVVFQMSINLTSHFKGANCHLRKLSDKFVV